MIKTEKNVFAIMWYKYIKRFYLWTIYYPICQSIINQLFYNSIKTECVFWTFVVIIPSSNQLMSFFWDYATEHSVQQSSKKTILSERHKTNCFVETYTRPCKSQFSVLLNDFSLIGLHVKIVHCCRKFLLLYLLRTKKESG